jgi:hypothetical protein
LHRFTPNCPTPAPAGNIRSHGQVSSREVRVTIHVRFGYGIKRMSNDADTMAFIRATFGSIWSLELLLILKRRPDHDWSRSELIAGLSASDQVLDRGTADLLAAGLIVNGAEQCIRYAPRSVALDKLAGDAARLFGARPTMVRRLIVTGETDPVTRFADAFRIRRD